MKHIAIERHIEFIVDASLDNLYYVSTRTGHLPSDQRFPVIIAYAQSATVQGYSSVEEKAARICNVTMLMLEKELQPETIPNANGKGFTRESELAYQTRLKARREEMILVFEQIINYLTNEDFPFKYEVVSDIDYAPVEIDENAFGLYGEQCTFSVSGPFVREHCCVDFDEAKIKTYNAKNFC